MPRRPKDVRLVRAFGDRVRAARLDAGLTQEQVAERAGLHRTYPGFVETGRMTPSLEAVVRIAEALGIDPGELVKGLTTGRSSDTE